MNSPLLNDYNLYLFHQGTNYHAYEMLGAHPDIVDGCSGIRFSVWAPRASAVSVIGDFNGWNLCSNPLRLIDDGEIWTAFVPNLTAGTLYKYAIEGIDGTVVMKADPYAMFAEKVPKTASIVWHPEYQWHDNLWQQKKEQVASYNQPMLIYEVHPGSWMRAENGSLPGYRELAERLIAYAKKMNYTHLEFLPLMEHPFDGSWGYQIAGYYAVTSRYGKPEDFMYLVDHAHQNGIGVIMDWVPGHFCNDEHGLRNFDGSSLYESCDEQRAVNSEWSTTNFDYGRTEVRSFLISNALFWLEKYHLDGLRIDAVANMLYLDYSRREGEWSPNKNGGPENLEAIDFIKQLNKAVFTYHPEALMMAEESSAWPMVTKPAEDGGLGFNYKWNMGWMNDILDYVSASPLTRKERHKQLTFSMLYAFAENFVLPLSHDEVVHGKRSLLGRQPGDYWQQFAGLRVFFSYWIAHPGKKLLFMGGEFGQFIEWNYSGSLDWHLPEQYPMHKKMLHFSAALNEFYCAHPELWQIDFSWQGFEWIDCENAAESIVSFIRKAANGQYLIVICNFSSECITDYRLGLPEEGIFEEIFNSDAIEFGGTGTLNAGDMMSEEVPWQEREQSLTLTIPALAAVILQRKGGR